MKRAIIVGYKGQDGTLLSQDLIQKGYEILGIGRNSVLSGDYKLTGSVIDVCKYSDVKDVMEYYKPDEVYYLAAHHSSSEIPIESLDIRNLFMVSQQVHVYGVLNFLSCIEYMVPKARLFYASSSMIFNGQKNKIQDEMTPVDPQCIYGLTKAQGMWLCSEYRRKKRVFAASGILYNHESHLRPERFLPSKVINAAIRIVSGSLNKLEVGNTNSIVDWGYAPDYVKAFQELLKLDFAEDFIIASGEGHTVQEFIDVVFSYFGLDRKRHVVVNENLLHRKPTVKIGNPKKLNKLTGWKSSYSFHDFAYRLIEDYLEAKGLPELKQ